MATPTRNTFTIIGCVQKTQRLEKDSENTTKEKEYIALTYLSFFRMRH